MSKNKTKMLKKKNQEKWRIKEKMMNEGTTKNDPWSDHPETQFGPIYPFFRNHKPWPTLRT